MLIRPHNELCKKWIDRISTCPTCEQTFHKNITEVPCDSCLAEMYEDRRKALVKRKQVSDAVVYVQSFFKGYL